MGGKSAVAKVIDEHDDLFDNLLGGDKKDKGDTAADQFYNKANRLSCWSSSVIERLESDSEESITRAKNESENSDEQAA